MKSFQEFASLLEDNSYLEKGKKASIVQGAVSGNPKALWLLSKQRIAENDIYSGETLLFQAAFENCPEAQGDIGDVYFYGRFNRENARRDPENINTIIQDDTTAANWYKQGYKNGSDYCTGQLGVCYDYGIGVEQNLENAQTLLQSGLLCKEQDFFGEYYFLKELLQATNTIQLDEPIQLGWEQSPITEKFKEVIPFLNLREKIKAQKEAVEYLRWDQEAAKATDKLRNLLTRYYNGSILFSILRVLLPLYWAVGLDSLLINIFFAEQFAFINYLLYYTAYPPLWITNYIFNQEKLTYSMEDMSFVMGSDGLIALILWYIILYFIGKGILWILKPILTFISRTVSEKKISAHLENIEKKASNAAAPTVQKLDHMLSEVNQKIEEAVAQLPLETHLKQASYIYPLYMEALNHHYDSFESLEKAFEKKLRDTERSKKQKKMLLPACRRRRIFKPIPWALEMGREEALKYFKGAGVKKNMAIALECALNYISAQCPVGGRGDGKNLVHLVHLYKYGEVDPVKVTPDPELSVIFQQAAIYLYEKEASLNNSYAMHELYYLYKDLDNEKSMYWAKEAIRHENPEMLFAAAVSPELFSVSTDQRIQYAKRAYELGVKDAADVIKTIQLNQKKKAQLEQEIRNFQRSQYKQEINRRMEEYREKLDWAERDMNQFFSDSYLTNEERHILEGSSYRDYGNSKTIREDLENRQRRKIEEEMKGE